MVCYRIEVSIADGFPIFDTSTDIDYDLCLIVTDMVGSDEMDDACTGDDDIGITT